MWNGKFIKKRESAIWESGQWKHLRLWKNQQEGLNQELIWRENWSILLEINISLEGNIILTEYSKIKGPVENLKRETYLWTDGENMKY